MSNKTNPFKRLYQDILKYLKENSLETIFFSVLFILLVCQKYFASNDVVNLIILISSTILFTVTSIYVFHRHVYSSFKEKYTRVVTFRDRELKKEAKKGNFSDVNGEVWKRQLFIFVTIACAYIGLILGLGLFLGGLTVINRELFFIPLFILSFMCLYLGIGVLFLNRFIVNYFQLIPYYSLMIIAEKDVNRLIEFKDFIFKNLMAQCRNKDAKMNISFGSQFIDILLLFKKDDIEFFKKYMLYCLNCISKKEYHKIIIEIKKVEKKLEKTSKEDYEIAKKFWCIKYKFQTFDIFQHLQNSYTANKRFIFRPLLLFFDFIQKYWVALIFIMIILVILVISIFPQTLERLAPSIDILMKFWNH
ncbi:MAG: hypothetical protein KC535_05910 [Nanoarchaeota archaeon]|nr:hypothetical protein [Nanoarchaeota archaeon]